MYSVLSYRSSWVLDALIWCAFASDLKYLVYRRSAGINWTSARDPNSWILWSSLDVQVHALVQAFIPPPTQGATEGLVLISFFAARNVIQTVIYVYLCNVDQVVYFRPTRSAIEKRAGSILTWPDDCDTYRGDVDGEKDGELSDILPSKNMYYCSSFRVVLRVIREKCSQHSTPQGSTAAVQSSWGSASETPW